MSQTIRKLLLKKVSLTVVSENTVTRKSNKSHFQGKIIKPQWKTQRRLKYIDRSFKGPNIM